MIMCELGKNVDIKFCKTDVSLFNYKKFKCVRYLFLKTKNRNIYTVTQGYLSKVLYVTHIT